MTEANPFLSGPQYLKKESLYATPQDISRLRQRVLNLEETIKELKKEIQDLKNS
jgi:cell division protein FtsL